MACHYHLFKWKNISIWLRLVCWFLQSTPGTASTQDFGIATVQSLQWYKLTLPNNINSENMHESYRSENKQLDRSFNIWHKMFGGARHSSYCFLLRASLRSFWSLCLLRCSMCEVDFLNGWKLWHTWWQSPYNVYLHLRVLQMKQIDLSRLPPK